MQIASVLAIMATLYSLVFFYLRSAVGVAERPRDDLGRNLIRDTNRQRSTEGQTDGVTFVVARPEVHVF